MDNLLSLEIHFLSLFMSERVLPLFEEVLDDGLQLLLSVLSRQISDTESGLRNEQVGVLLESSLLLGEESDSGVHIDLVNISRLSEVLSIQKS